MAPTIQELARKCFRTEIGGLMVVDVRCAFPDLPAPCPFVPIGDPRNPLRLWPVSRIRDLGQLASVVIHNDGVLFAPGDHDYDGTTLDEDLVRLRAIWQRGLDMGWGGSPYHIVASPNAGAVYICRDYRTFGAHVARANHRRQAVAIMGNFNDAMPSTHALCGGARGVAVLRALDGQRDLPIIGHQELHATSCPGKTWGSWSWTLEKWADRFTAICAMPAAAAHGPVQPTAL